MSHTLRQPNTHYHLPHGIEYIDSHRTITGVFTSLAVVLWVTTGLLIELLAVRFMIAFLGADPANSFFQFIYVTSQPFIAPFASAFGDFVQLGPNRVEFYTLIAIAFYALVGYSLAKVMSHTQLSAHDKHHH